MAVTTFTTLARVKVDLQTGGADPLPTTHDDYLNELLRAYSAEFERYLGRYSQVVLRQEQYDVEPGMRVVALNAYPVSSVSTVTNDSGRDFDSGDVSSDDYYLSAKNGLLEFDKTALVSGPGVLRVTYTGGLGTNTTALVRDFPDLAHACDIQVVYHFRRRRSLGASGLSQGGGNVSWEGALDLLPTVKQILDRRRRVRF